MAGQIDTATFSLWGVEIGAMPVLLGATTHTDILIKSHSVQGVLSRARTTRLFKVRATYKEGASND